MSITFEGRLRVGEWRGLSFDGLMVGQIRFQQSSAAATYLGPDEGFAFDLTDNSYATYDRGSFAFDFSDNSYAIRDPGTFEFDLASNNYLLRS